MRRGRLRECGEYEYECEYVITRVPYTACVCARVCLQTYSNEAVDHVQELLLQAQKTKRLPSDLFKVRLTYISKSISTSTYTSCLRALPTPLLRRFCGILSPC